ncbi:ferric uptake regulator, Fur family [Desulfovibrio sp. X2]|uniref:Fur family transcriptional regulator n=1 Tax=Desulfovibrio sp. X2 TaxID=941449 RepID=UPI000358AF64|nr:Fur family transcriptional regulator [Desulfovibrio sp. X2]EPR41223.1 ferric uptake regulator, Fur family [Desulfovibrio sp. X2]
MDTTTRTTSTRPESAPRAERMLGQLRDKGLRITPQREAIVRLLAEDFSHPSADAVFRRAVTLHPWMSRATVYNTLNSLIEAGVIQDIDLDTERRFDGTGECPHGHTVCRGCGKVEDVDLPRDFDLAAKALARAGFSTERLQVKLIGLCRECAAKAE